MAGYAHALALARAEGVTARELLPFAKGIAEILPPIFEETGDEADTGRFAGGDNPLTSAVSTMSHVIETSEGHGIDAGVIRAVAGLAGRAVGLGYAEDGFIRVVDMLVPRKS